MKQVKDKKAQAGIILLLLIGIALAVIALYVVWWAIGTVFGIFGYTVTFWEKIAILIILLVFGGIGIRFKRGGGE